MFRAGREVFMVGTVCDPLTLERRKLTDHPMRATGPIQSELFLSIRIGAPYVFFRALTSFSVGMRLPTRWSELGLRLK